ncbi:MULTISPECIES: Cys-tRNA(Pro) deacylase [unclassified Sphingomonas]|uniref:Cys-tRNA(Pro) deacylase n=1 Tax=unclassified Sphingomonas TaxID=196159 RepID=UPI0006FE6EF1|nr:MULTISPECIES: Cys-tRNA(Pro) deacylase [unclassified Sphingomonas]KQX20722.1 cys-tRNA(pro)/cys-tRNA(cys) deacylase [Sphingomonas sp. Root1294]KQY68568.1 cys-tRNA(pro)/cys-tRNA(cys) deacylase [Sphingomonas sp. Root50]KRB87974.1 cys-tRNA(pro)/cys-tRNA(cys) deacylase [Sphingomonas sp. Root720]
MSRSTRATQFLTQAKIAYGVLSYDYDPGGERVGLQAAEALGEDPCRVLKTLMIEIDGRPACAVIPSDRELSMKKAAAAFGAKSAQMMKPADAERITGYHVGGISPFGQKKRVPVAIEQAAMAEALVTINGGQRGLQVRLAPGDAAKALGAAVAALVAD